MERGVRWLEETGRGAARGMQRCSPARGFAAVAVLAALVWPASGLAEALAQFESRGLPRSQGVVVRLQHPAGWQRVEADDELAMAELRGPHGNLTAILQIARGRRQADMPALCKPERARTMMLDVAGREPGTRVTDVVARAHQGRPAFEIRYERSDAPLFLVARSMIICLADSRLVVSCAGAGPAKAGLAQIEPVCRQVLESVTVAEE